MLLTITRLVLDTYYADTSADRLLVLDDIILPVVVSVTIIILPVVRYLDAADRLLVLDDIILPVVSVTITGSIPLLIDC